MNQNSCALDQAIELVEQNEDTIAAIVENIQLYRLVDCVTLYGNLQKNLVALGKELDNYPPSDIDLFKEIDNFPDELMRKDILQELQSFNDTNVYCPSLIIPSSCRECAKKKIPKEECRLVSKHVSPSHTFSKTEQNSFLQVADMLSKIDRSHKMDELNGTQKRIHKKWTDFERFTVLVAIYVFKQDKVVSNLVNILENRSSEMVRSHMKHLDKHVIENAERGMLPPAPLGWQAHSSLFKRYNKLVNRKPTSDKDSVNASSWLSPAPKSFENNFGIAIQDTILENNINDGDDDDDIPERSSPSPQKLIENTDPHSLYYNTIVPDNVPPFAVPAYTRHNYIMDIFVRNFASLQAQFTENRKQFEEVLKEKDIMTDFETLHGKGKENVASNQPNGVPSMVSAGVPITSATRPQVPVMTTVSSINNNSSNINNNNISKIIIINNSNNDDDKFNKYDTNDNKNNNNDNNNKGSTKKKKDRVSTKKQSEDKFPSNNISVNKTNQAFNNNDDNKNNNNNKSKSNSKKRKSKVDDVNTNTVVTPVSSIQTERRLIHTDFSHGITIIIFLLFLYYYFFIITIISIIIRRL